MKKGIFLLLPVIVACAGCATNTKSTMDTYYAGNYSEAFKQFSKLANNGDPDAQFMLGHMYEYGEGVPKDAAQALIWLKKAADQGNASAQFKVGYLYDIGEGVPQDRETAKQWYKKSLITSQGREGVTAGELFLNGNGVPKDIPTGLKWIERGAQYGDMDANLRLEEIYELGEEGVKKDPVKAEYYYNQVATQQTDSKEEFVKYFHKILLSHEYSLMIKLHKNSANTYFIPGGSGLTVISFDLIKNKPLNVAIKKSCGNKELDAMGLKLIKESVFPLPPASFSGKHTYQIAIPFKY